MDPGPVVIVGPRDAWISGRATRPLHWDGRHLTPWPRLSSADVVMSSSASNTWFLTGTEAGVRTQHWDGRRLTPRATIKSREAYPAQYPSSGLTWSADNVWAITSSGIGTPWLRHWNGTRWHDARTGRPVTRIAGLSPDDMWAASSPSYIEDPWDSTARLMHWNGKRWRTTPIANLHLPKGAEFTITDLVPVSPTDAWAVGYVEATWTSRLARRPIALRWDGHTWNPILQPTTNAKEGMLTLAARDGSGGVWLVLAEPNRSYLLHPGSTTWTRLEIPTPAGAEVNGLALVPGTTRLWLNTSTDDTVTLLEYHHPGT